jgi:hypothetical protein
MPDDVVVQKIASIDRCLSSVRKHIADDIDRLHDAMVLDAVVLNLQRACEQATDAACREVSRRGLGVPTDSADEGITTTFDGPTARHSPAPGTASLP